MDLTQHIAVLWRFRAVVVAGLVLGTALAVLAAYQVPSMELRGSETWSSDSSLLVTQAGFPEGRVTLPGAPTNETGAFGTAPLTPKDQLQFADPGRLSALASLYAQLAVSDQVRKRLPERPKASQILATPVEGNSGTQLPVIKLTSFAQTEPGARALNLHVVEALSEVLASEQTENRIPTSQRVKISLLNAPASPLKTSGRSHTASILAFLLCLLGSIAVAHLLAVIRDREEDEALDGVVVPWSSVQDGGSQPPQADPMPAGVGPPPGPATRLSARRRAP